MSKQRLKQLKEKFYKKELPRTEEVLRQEYAKLAANLGQVQYQIYVLKQEQERLNRSISNVNNEVADRRKLDAAEIAKKTEEQKNA